MSPRKRTPSNESTETTTGAAEPTPAEPPTAEPPAAEANANPQSFVEKVGQKKWVEAPDPFGIATDYMAGVRLFQSRNDHQMAIKFGDGRPEDKPSQAVIDKMKEAGFRWKSVHRIWAHPVGGESAMRTRIDAEKLYQEVRQMIRKEKGIEATQDIPPLAVSPYDRTSRLRS